MSKINTSKEIKSVSYNGVNIPLKTDNSALIGLIQRSITTLEIPDSVTSIGNYAFYLIHNLTELNIPEGVTSIGTSAFSGCTNLISVTIPNSVTSIGSNAFNQCDNLSMLTYSNAKYLGNDANPYLVLRKSASTSITSCEINGNTRFILESAFYQCSGLTNITIPNSVTSIGSSAFGGCNNLSKVNYTGTIEDWCNIKFYGETSNPLSMAKKLYINNELVTDVHIPNSITSIGRYVFYNCSGLTSVTLPSSLTSIGIQAFYKCSGLTGSITIPEGVTRIEDMAFQDCSNLTGINYNATSCSDLRSNNYVFYKTGQSGEGITVNIGANVEKIPAYLFNPYSTTAYAPKLTSVVFAEGSVCESIGGFAFQGCANLSSITLPTSITSIGRYTFNGCSGLTNITIGSGITSIGERAFYKCSKLTEMTILATTPPILSGTEAISSAITKIYIPAGTLSAYKTATNWSMFASKFVELSV